MRWVGLLFLATVAAWLQHGPLALLRAPPDLSLALLAWAVLAWDDRRALPAAWVIGLARDVAAPGTQWFHAVAYLVIVAAGLRWLERLRGWRIGGMVAAGVVAHVAVVVIDMLLARALTSVPRSLVAGAIGTGAVAGAWAALVQRRRRGSRSTTLLEPAR
ncbi:MAG: hypothetical protein ACOCYV_00880 [Planctomycetota bacterium]